MSDISATELRRRLAYDPNTGIFTRLIAYGKRAVGAVAGCRSSRYSLIRLGGKNYMAHRLAWLYVHGVWPAQFIDHIDGDGFNNRLSNLREADHTLNAQNQRRAPKHNALGILGVRHHKGGFEARISHAGQSVFLGRFKTPDAAQVAYIEAKRILHLGCTI